MSRQGDALPCVQIVDDDEAVRASLVALLVAHGYRALAFPSAEALLAAAEPGAGGCLLLDLRLARTGGLELQARLASRGASLPVIFITGYGDVAAARQAFRAGAVDFLEKPVDADALLAAVENALATDRKRRDADAASRAFADRMARLTAREHEVLELVCTGQRNRDIAVALGVSPRTVEIHKARVMGKLKVGGLAELLRARRLVEQSPS